MPHENQKLTATHHARLFSGISSSLTDKIGTDFAIMPREVI